MSLPAVRDCNPDPVFPIPGFGIGESLIPGSRRDYRDSGIRDSSVLNPGTKKTGTGLQALDYRFAFISTSRWPIQKINCLCFLICLCVPILLSFPGQLSHLPYSLRR